MSEKYGGKCCLGATIPGYGHSRNCQGLAPPIERLSQNHEDEIRKWGDASARKCLAELDAIRIELDALRGDLLNTKESFNLRAAQLTAANISLNYARSAFEWICKGPTWGPGAPTLAEQLEMTKDVATLALRRMSELKPTPGLVKDVQEAAKDFIDAIGSETPGPAETRLVQAVDKLAASFSE